MAVLVLLEGTLYPWVCLSPRPPALPSLICSSWAHCSASLPPWLCSSILPSSSLLSPPRTCLIGFARVWGFGNRIGVGVEVPCHTTSELLHYLKLILQMKGKSWAKETHPFCLKMTIMLFYGLLNDKAICYLPAATFAYINTRDAWFLLAPRYHFMKTQGLSKISVQIECPFCISLWSAEMLNAIELIPGQGRHP